jgi:hypothetical protein
MVSMVKGTTRKLVCSVGAVDGQHWSALAAEVAGDAETTAAVLADHGHKLIGRFAHPDDAIAACEGYAKAWLANQEQIERCGCDELPGVERRKGARRGQAPEDHQP